MPKSCRPRPTISSAALRCRTARRLYPEPIAHSAETAKPASAWSRQSEAASGVSPTTIDQLSYMGRPRAVAVRVTGPPGPDPLLGRAEGPKSASNVRSISRYGLRAHISRTGFLHGSSKKALSSMWSARFCSSVHHAMKRCLSGQFNFANRTG